MMSENRTTKQKTEKKRWGSCMPLQHKNGRVQNMTAQELYVRQHRRTHILVRNLQISFFILFLVIWELSARLEIIDSFFFCSPSIVAECAVKMLFQEKLSIHFAYSFGEILISFLFIFGISFLTALLLWFCNVAAKVTEPFLVVLNALPKSALAPLFIVWIGTGVKTIIVAGISVAVFGSIINLYSGFKETDPEKILLVQTLGGNRIDILLKVVIPSSIPNIISVMKVNIGLSMVGVIIGEFFAGRRGLGYLIIYGTQVFQLDMVLTSIIILCFLAVILYVIIQGMEHRYLKKVGAN